MPAPELRDFEEAVVWLESAGRSTTVKPHLLLGNGFSIAYDASRFTYSALVQRAKSDNLIGPIAGRLFDTLSTVDFEVVIKALADAARALEAVHATKYAVEIRQLEREVDQLKEALAQVLAGLHPERPYEIDEDAYVRVRTLLDRFKNIYTASYDLLLYWTLMQDLDQLPPRTTDDGFRDPGYDAEYVLWDYLNPHAQCVFYLHGALHLFRGEDGLRKLTWRRTEEPLIDQIRAQLAADFFPLYVAEGSSAEKLRQIHTSDYLARAHRSLAAVGGGLLVYGLSFSENDAHILDAVVRSKVDRLAVSVYGDVRAPANRALITNARALIGRRSAIKPKKPLEVEFFDADSVELW